MFIIILYTYIYKYRHTTESELSSQRYRSLRLRRLRRLWRLWPIDCHEDRGEKHPDPEPVKTVKRSGRGQEEVRKCEMFMNRCWKRCEDEVDEIDAGKTGQMPEMHAPVSMNLKSEQIVLLQLLALLRGHPITEQALGFHTVV